VRDRSDLPVTRLAVRTETDVISALAVSAPGLAPLVARELLARGIPPREVGVEGVSFEASLAGVYEANLWLRTASRIVIRLATFHADSFHELERRSLRVPWRRYLDRATPVRMRVTCRKSRLYHSDAVAERIGSAIVQAGGTLAPRTLVSDASAESDDELGVGRMGEQLIVVRLVRDRCVISLDSSGDLLHRRGYRQETAKAPLRETLAAATLMAAGWSAQGPLLDPMCGAGTIAVEAAWLARRRAPGLGRSFAFMHWPEFDAGAWQTLVGAAQATELAAAPVPIIASDRDAGAIAAARGNAERAGVSADITISQRPISAIDPLPGPGWLVTNPPYGVRVGVSQELRQLYAELGQVAHAKCRGCTVALLAADRELAQAVRLPFVSKLRTRNGGIPVEVLVAPVDPERARIPA
jgi:putative N6-adenine-specific DNA methylase